MDRDEARKAYQRARHWVDFLQHRQDQLVKPLMQDIQLLSRAVVEDWEFETTVRYSTSPHLGYIAFGIGGWTVALIAILW